MTSSRERLYWALGGAVVLVTWSTLKWARAAAEWLREAGMIDQSMWAIFAVAGGSVLLFVVRKRPRWLELAVLGGFGLVYLLTILSLMGRAEETLHFVQYGLVGGLFYAALTERRSRSTGSPSTGSPSPRRWLGRPGAAGAVAFLMTGAAGWIDEGIQHLLPERVYDLRDVAFNAAAGALAIAAIASRRWARSRGASLSSEVLG